MNKITKSLVAAFVIALFIIASAAVATPLRTLKARYLGTTAEPVTQAYITTLTGVTSLSATSFSASTVTATTAMVAPTLIATGTDGLVVSTSATSSGSMQILGAVVDLSTEGYSAGAMVYLTSDATLYVATETVTSSGSWKAAW